MRKFTNLSFSCSMVLYAICFRKANCTGQIGEPSSGMKIMTQSKMQIKLHRRLFGFVFSL